jgi:hypothetical protein
MKNKIYNDLIKFGFSVGTLKKLTESDAIKLHKNLIERKKETKEVVSSTETMKTTKYTASDVQNLINNKGGVNVSNGEVTPTPGGGFEVKQKLNAGKSEKPKNKIINDGELGEAKKKKGKYNPWAICTSSVGREDKKKYERCVKDVKKQVKEGKNPYEVIIESKIISLVEKHITPKMKKGDIVDLVGKTKMDKPIGKLTSVGKTNEDKGSTSDFWKSLEGRLKKETNEAPTQTMDAPIKRTIHTQQKGSKQNKPKKALPNWLKFDSLNIKFKK